MERRTALAYAAAAAGIALAGSTAVAAVSGVLGQDDHDPVEIEGISTPADDVVQATTTTLPEPTVVTVVVDEYVTAPATGSGQAVDDRGGLRLAAVSDDAPDTFAEGDDRDEDDGWDEDDSDADDSDEDEHDDDEVEVEVEDEDD